MTKKKVAYNEADACWHLMVRTYDGKVSMLKNLDAPTARQAYKRLRHRDYPVEYINHEGLSNWGGQSYSVSSSDVRSVDILGPEGAELDPWRGVKPRIIDLGPERERQKARREKRELDVNAHGDPVKPINKQSWIDRLLG